MHAPTWQAQAYHYLLKPKDPRAAEKNAPYAHCIDLKVLYKVSVWSREDALADLRSHLAKEQRLLIVSADESRQTDVSRLADSWGLPYRQVPLVRWESRPESKPHRVSREKYKTEEGVKFGNVICPYHQLHTIKPNPKKVNVVKHGAHCALLDVLELLEHIQEHQDHSYLEEILDLREQVAYWQKSYEDQVNRARFRSEGGAV